MWLSILTIFSLQMSEEERLQTLDKVLSRLEVEGMRLKRDWCAFMLSRVEYLGHVITAEGLHLAEDKIRAILKAPAPDNVAIYVHLLV